MTLRKRPPPKRRPVAHKVVRSKPKPKPKPKPQPKRAPSKTQQALTKARESLANISRESDKVEEVHTEPNPELPQLRVDAEPAQSVARVDSDYRDEMARRLRLILRLPDYGAVRVEVTIAKRGAVKSLEVVSAASEVNRAYIEQVLPTVTFAPIGSWFGNTNEKTFTITLENDQI